MDSDSVIDLSPEVIQLIHKVFEESVGSILIGYTFASIFYGCSLVQTFIYFRMSPRDGSLLKTSVFLLWLLDTAHTALLAAVMYIIVVKDMDNIFQISKATWMFSVAIFVTCLIELGVRGLFINRIWKLSRNNVVIAIFLSLITTAVFVLSIHFGISVYHMQQFWEIRQKPSLVYLPFAVGLASDIAITGTQCVLLWRNKTGFTASDSIVHSLMAYILNSGILICLVTAGILISYAVSNSLIFMGIYVVLPKAFFNAILVSLNIRGLVFGESVELPPPSGSARPKERRKLAIIRSSTGKSELAVRVETTTLHQVEADKINEMWMPMQPIDRVSVDQKSVVEDICPTQSMSDLSHTHQPGRPGMRRYK